MLFGASYYHEYQPHERLEADLDLMIAAGFTVIRVGESTWSSYEPQDGMIDFDALVRVVSAATERGLKVIVGTPTYAVPSWLARTHPEVMAQDSITHTIPYGARQNVDFTSPAYLFYAERLLRRMAAAFAPIDGVIGFQVDNEIGVVSLTNPAVVERFRSFVMSRLGGTEGANTKWGLTYWSHRLATPADLWAPDGNTNPGYALEWERFQDSLTAEFLTWQRDILREYIKPEQFVIHDQVGGHSNRSTGTREIAAATDHAAANIYIPLQKALELPEPPAEEIAPLSPGWARDAGTWAATWRADMAYALRGERGEPFFITEAQATSIGGPDKNIPPYPGQLRLIAHLFASRGADLLAYWHWHSLHYGFETYWGGVLGHDLEPNRIFQEVSELGAELKELTPIVDGSVPDSDVAMLYSRDSLKALGFMPPFDNPGTAEPDPAPYHTIFSRLYQGALDSRLQVRIVYEDSDWAGISVLIVPALYVSSDELLDRIVAAAETGVHVLVTFRTGYADEWARVRPERQPARLREAVGASYQEFTNIVSAVPLTASSSTLGLDLPSGATASLWADGLIPEGAAVLASYSDPFLGRFAAITSQEVGRGRITWLGTLPDRGTTAGIVAWALAERGLDPKAAAWTDLPESVRVTSSTGADGTRLWFVANHSWQTQEFTPPCTLTVCDPLGDQAPLTRIVLGAWGSRVLKSEPR